MLPSAIIDFSSSSPIAPEKFFIRFLADPPSPSFLAAASIPAKPKKNAPIPAVTAATPVTIFAFVFSSVRAPIPILTASIAPSAVIDSGVNSIIALLNPFITEVRPV